ncbi:hypothetical protein RKD20_005644 [Streptomyces sp. SLBN-8D4]|jgi:hypothetical protein
MTSEGLDRMVIGVVCLSVCLGLVALLVIYAWTWPATASLSRRAVRGTATSCGG